MTENLAGMSSLKKTVKKSQTPAEVEQAAVSARERDLRRPGQIARNAAARSA